MPKLARESSEVQDYGVVEARETASEGYTINFLTFRENIDHRPLLKGLPDDRCQCPHWGYVFKGRMTFRFGDREEVFEAGDAFYAPPGHIPVENEPGTEYLQFSPTDDLQKTSEVIMKNMQQLQHGTEA
jgi:mannose-6-phosphate isomerase-like protein (cupin superfamily)